MYATMVCENRAGVDEEMKECKHCPSDCNSCGRYIVRAEDVDPVIKAAMELRASTFDALVREVSNEFERDHMTKLWEALANCRRAKELEKGE